MTLQSHNKAAKTFSKLDFKCYAETNGAVYIRKLISILLRYCKNSLSLYVQWYNEFIDYHIECLWLGKKFDNKHIMESCFSDDIKPCKLTYVKALSSSQFNNIWTWVYFLFSMKWQKNDFSVFLMAHKISLYVSRATLTMLYNSNFKRSNYTMPFTRKNIENAERYIW